MPATADRAFACAKSVSYGWRMSRTQKQIGLVGLVLFTLASLIVPWKSLDGESAGYSLIFAPPVRFVPYTVSREESTRAMLATAAGDEVAAHRSEHYRRIDDARRDGKRYGETHYDARIDLLRLFLVMGFVMVATIAAVLLTKDAPHFPEAAG